MQSQKHAENLRIHMKINARDHLEFLIANLEAFAREVQPLWHPLGFTSCVIREKIDGVTLRVHYWPPGERRTKNPDWPVHTHTYALSSLILTGQIEDIQYQAQEGDQHVVYQVLYKNGDSEILKTKDGISINDTKAEIRSAGDQYRVERGVFHQSRVAFNASAVTLVAMSEFSDAPPLVLGKPGAMRYPYDRTPFCRDRFWYAVRDALASFE